jgi:hypothetical protein
MTRSRRTIGLVGMVVLVVMATSCSGSSVAETSDAVVQPNHPPGDEPVSGELRMGGGAVPSSWYEDPITLVRESTAVIEGTIQEVTEAEPVSGLSYINLLIKPIEIYKSSDDENGPFRVSIPAMDQPLEHLQQQLVGRNGVFFLLSLAESRAQLTPPGDEPDNRVEGYRPVFSSPILDVDGGAVLPWVLPETFLDAYIDQPYAEVRQEVRDAVDSAASETPPPTTLVLQARNPGGAVLPFTVHAGSELALETVIPANQQDWVVQEVQVPRRNQVLWFASGVRSMGSDGIYPFDRFWIIVEPLEDRGHPEVTVTRMEPATTE